MEAPFLSLSTSSPSLSLPPSLQEFADKARSGKLQPHEYQGGSFRWPNTQPLYLWHTHTYKHSPSPLLPVSQTWVCTASRSSRPLLTPHNQPSYQWVASRQPLHLWAITRGGVLWGWFGSPCHVTPVWSTTSWPASGWRCSRAYSRAQQLKDFSENTI